MRNWAWRTLTPEGRFFCFFVEWNLIVAERIPSRLIASVRGDLAEGPSRQVQLKVTLYHPAARRNPIGMCCVRYGEFVTTGQSIVLDTSDAVFIKNLKFLTVTFRDPVEMARSIGHGDGYGPGVAYPQEVLLLWYWILVNAMYCVHCSHDTWGGIWGFIYVSAETCGPYVILRGMDLIKYYHNADCSQDAWRYLEHVLKMRVAT